MNAELIIFDLDDTLVDTSHVYWTARKEFINALAQEGIEENYLLELFESIDEKNIKTVGFIPERYEQTMVEVYGFLSEEGRLKKDAQLEAKIRKHGRIVVTQLPMLINGAKHLLTWASGRFKMVLMTRGVEALQKRKIDFSEIASYFDYIHIVPKKEVSDFQRLISEAGYLPRNTWVIGDSIRSDINPASEAGAKCILYQYTHPSYHWRQEYGVTPRGSFFRVERLEDAVAVLENPDSAPMTTPEEWAALVKTQNKVDKL